MGHCRQASALGAVLVAMALGSPSARADAGDHDRALATFDEARRLIEAGDCPGGVVKLEQSLMYEPSVGANLSMADCAETRDPLVAWQRLREAERLAYLRHDDRLGIAQQRAAALESRLALVHVQVPPADLLRSGFELRLDGVLVDPYFLTEGTLGVVAGPHVLSASLPSRRWSQRVIAQVGATTPVAVDLREVSTPAPAAAVPAVRADRDVGSTRRTIAYALGGAGLAALAAATTFGVVALTKQSDIESACGGSPAACTARPGTMDGTWSEQHAFSRLSDVTFVTAGALLTAAVVLYVSTPSGPETRVELAPMAGRDGASLALSGRW